MDPRTLIELNARLARIYGPRPLHPNGDPLSELIFTLLSQATNDRNRDRAFAALRRAFPAWEDVAAADPADVARAIAPAGLGPQKAPRIIAILRQIAADPRSGGRPDLSFLSDLNDHQAFAYLSAMPGVGPKTAACVLLFALGRPIFPVDTHIHRLARRLGLVPDKRDAARTQEDFAAAIPSDAAVCHELHLNLIAHGRAVCHPRRPECGRCVLSDICPAEAASEPTRKPASPTSHARRTAESE